MSDSRSYDFEPNDRLSGRDAKSVPSKRTPSTGRGEGTTKRSYLLAPTGSSNGEVLEEYKPLR